MKRTAINIYKRQEIFIIAFIISIVFIAAAVMFAWLMRSSTSPASYEELSKEDLREVFVTGYLRFREDDGSPYLKVELHNGTLWWIKKVELEFDGKNYTILDQHAFKPLHFGAKRVILQRPPKNDSALEFDLRILKAYGYPPAEDKWTPKTSKPHQRRISLKN